jgi:hypothetical protein
MGLRIPKLTLENDKGLSIELKKQLQDNLIKKAKSLIDKEMIYELCPEIQEFYHHRNHSMIKCWRTRRELIMIMIRICICLILIGKSMRMSM